MKVEKDGIIKEVEDKLAKDYISAGWKKSEDKSKKEEKVKDGDKV
jgi:hypothetical protein